MSLDRRGRFSIRDGRSAASSIQGYEPAGPILDYALKPQIMAPGYLPEAFAINDSCKADGRKRRVHFLREKARESISIERA